MKSFAKFIFSVLVVVCSFLVLDFFVGKVLDRILAKIPNDGNGIAETYFSVNKVNFPVLITGSSRAHHHYIPEIIEDSLKMDAYNLGMDGHFLSYSCAIINTILDRYTPQTLLLEVSLDEMYKGGIDRIHCLHPYYHLNSYIKGVIDTNEGSTTKFKMILNSYRYNGSVLSIIGRWILGKSDYDKMKGLLPLYTVQNQNTKLEYRPLPDGDQVVDVYRVQLFEKTIRRLKEEGVMVYCFDSPYYLLLNPNRNTESEHIMKDICSKYEIPFFDNRQLPEFLSHPEYFYDKYHLNYEGSKVYTNYILKEILQEFEYL